MSAPETDALWKAVDGLRDDFHRVQVLLEKMLTEFTTFKTFLCERCVERQKNMDEIKSWAKSELQKQDDRIKTLESRVVWAAGVASGFSFLGGLLLTIALKKMGLI